MFIIMLIISSNFTLYIMSFFHYNNKKKNNSKKKFKFIYKYTVSCNLGTSIHYFLLINYNL